MASNKRVMFNYASSINQNQYIAPGITTQKWRNGQAITDYNRGGITQQNNKWELRDGVYSRTFYVPILSGVMGHLIPKDSWKLIPGKGCGKMTWEFRLNRYAFYSSGHLDNDDSTGNQTSVPNE